MRRPDIVRINISRSVLVTFSLAAACSYPLPAHCQQAGLETFNVVKALAFKEGCTKTFDQAAFARNSKALKPELKTKYKAGIDALARTDYEDAVRDLSQVLAASPTNCGVMIALGEALIFTGEYEKSISVFSSAIKSPDITADEKCEAYMRRGSAYLIAGMKSLAIDDLTKAIGGKDQKAHALKLRGACYRTMNIETRAIADLRQCLTMLPDDRAVLMELGSYDLFHHQYASSVTEFERLTSLHPKFADGWAFKAQALLCNKEYKKAIEAAQRALALGTHHVGTCNLIIESSAKATVEKSNHHQK